MGMAAMQRQIDQLQRVVYEQQRIIDRITAKPRLSERVPRLQILQATSAISGRTEVTAGEAYEVAHGTARVFDLLIRAGSGAYDMNVIKDSSDVERTVELANIWAGDIAADAFLLGAPYGSVFVPASEECE